MTKFAKSDDGLWHVARDEKGRMYIRLGQNPPFIMADVEGREFFEGLKEVYGERDYDDAA